MNNTILTRFCFIVILTAICNRCCALEDKGYDDFQLIEGDILLRLEEDFTNRNAMKDRKFRWTDGAVPYKLSDKYSAVDKKLIREAMDEFENIAPACIRFIEKHSSAVDYLEIAPIKGCASFVGKNGGKQQLSLASPGCMKKGTIMHELMHSLGFRHEQSRADRDNFVTIHWDNIKDGRETSFNKYSWEVLDHLNTSYDYSSLMHYHAWEFAEDKKKPTISPKQDGVYLYELGFAQDKGQFTKTDIAKLMRYYEC